MLSRVVLVVIIMLVCGCSHSRFERVNYSSDGAFTLTCKSSLTGIGSLRVPDGAAARLVGLRDQLCQQAPDEWTVDVGGQVDQKFQREASFGVTFSCKAVPGGDPLKQRIMATEACDHVIYGKPV